MTCKFNYCIEIEGLLKVTGSLESGDMSETLQDTIVLQLMWFQLTKSVVRVSLRQLSLLLCIIFYNRCR